MAVKHRPINNDMTALPQSTPPLRLLSRWSMREPVANDQPQAGGTSAAERGQLTDTVPFLHPQSEPFEASNEVSVPWQTPKKALPASRAVPSLLTLPGLPVTLHLRRARARRTTLFWISFSDPQEIVPRNKLKYHNLQQFQQHFLTIMPIARSVSQRRSNLFPKSMPAIDCFGKQRLAMTRIVVRRTTGRDPVDPRHCEERSSATNQSIQRTSSNRLLRRKSPRNDSSWLVVYRRVDPFNPRHCEESRGSGTTKQSMNSQNSQASSYKSFQPGFKL